MKFRTNYANLTPSKGETFEGKSQTIPNDAYTIKEILEMSAKGMEQLQRPAQYLTIDDLQAMGNKFFSPAFDLIDIADLNKEFTDLQTRYLDAVEKDKAEKLAAEAAAEAAAETPIVEEEPLTPE